MAPKRANARDIAPSSAATTQAGPTTAGTVPAAPTATTTAAKPHKTSSTVSSSSLSSLTKKDSWEQIAGNLWSHYLKETPQRTKLIDAFMAFLVVVGAVQFLYCVLAGNYVRNPESFSEGLMIVSTKKKKTKC
jgi:oligosaccharyltransferase complex subunit epsilon